MEILIYVYRLIGTYHINKFGLLSSEHLLYLHFCFKITREETITTVFS